MAKFYVPVEGETDEVSKIYTPKNNLSNSAAKGYCSKDGVSKLFFLDRDFRWRREASIPVAFRLGSAVVFNGKIHLLGGENRRYHYTFNGSSWTRVSDLPFDFYNGSAISFDGKIHCFGGNGAESQYYTYDGSSWTHETNLPDTWINPYYHIWVGIQGLNHATIYNGKLTLAGSNQGYQGTWKHIATLNNGTWSVQWNALGNDAMYSSVGYDGLIYLLGDSGTGGTKYNTWNGSSQSGYSSLPYQFQYGYALEFKGKIHLLGGAHGDREHYEFNGSTFTARRKIPYSGFVDCPAVVYKNRLHVFGSGTNHCSYGKIQDIYSTLYPNAEVYKKGIVAQTDGQVSPIEKESNGDAIVFISKNGASISDWVYTCSIALTEEAAQLYAPNEDYNTTSHEIDGKTYWFSLHADNEATEISSPIKAPILNDLYICEPNQSPTTERVAEIIELLGIDTA